MKRPQEIPPCHVVVPWSAIGKRRQLWASLAYIWGFKWQ